MLACLIVDNTRDQQEVFDRYITNNLKSESARLNVVSLLNELSAHIHKLAPCEAMFPGNVHSDKPAYCTQEQVC